MREELPEGLATPFLASVGCCSGSTSRANARILLAQSAWSHWVNIAGAAAHQHLGVRGPAVSVTTPPVTVAAVTVLYHLNLVRRMGGKRHNGQLSRHWDANWQLSSQSSKWSQARNKQLDKKRQSNCRTLCVHDLLSITNSPMEDVAHGAEQLQAHHLHPLCAAIVGPMSSMLPPACTAAGHPAAAVAAAAAARIRSAAASPPAAAAAAGFAAGPPPVLPHAVPRSPAVHAAALGRRPPHMPPLRGHRHSLWCRRSPAERGQERAEARPPPPAIRWAA